MKKGTAKPTDILPRKKGRKPKHPTTDSRCKLCVYASKFPSPMYDMEWGCMYIVDEMHSRGCPAGRNCTRFVPGKRKEKEAI